MPVWHATCITGWTGVVSRPTDEGSNCQPDMNVSLVLSLHLLAAIVWIGGMVFLSMVLVPVFRREGGLTGERQRVFHGVARRFRVVVWVSVAILVLTGPILLSGRTDKLGESGAWLAILEAKLSLVGLLILLTAVHDFWLGPLRLRRLGSSSGAAGASGGVLHDLVPWIARVALLVGLGIVVLGAVLVKS